MMFSSRRLVSSLLGWAFGFACVGALPAVAAPVPVAGPSAVQFVLGPDGELSLKNMTAGPLTINSYNLVCDAGCLAPGAWNSIADQANSADMAVKNATLAALGAGAATFAETENMPGSLKELSPTSGAVLAGGAMFSIGKVLPVAPAQVTAWQNDLSLVASVCVEGGDKACASSIVVPEPTTLAFLLVGASGAGLVIARRRS